MLGISISFQMCIFYPLNSYTCIYFGQTMSISHAYLMSVNQMVQHIYLSKCYPLSKHYSKAFSFTSLLKDGSEASLLFYLIGSLHMFLSVYIYPLNAYSQCIFYLWW